MSELEKLKNKNKRLKQKNKKYLKLIKYNITNKIAPINSDLIYKTSKWSYIIKELLEGIF